MKYKKIILLAITFTAATFSANTDPLWSDLGKLEAEKDNILQSLKTCERGKVGAQLRALVENTQAIKKLKQEMADTLARYFHQTCMLYEQYDSELSNKKNIILEQVAIMQGLKVPLIESVDAYVAELNQQEKVGEQERAEQEQKIVGAKRIRFIRFCGYISILDEYNNMAKLYDEMLFSCAANRVCKIAEVTTAQKDYSTHDAREAAAKKAQAAEIEVKKGMVVQASWTAELLTIQNDLTLATIAGLNARLPIKVTHDQ